MKRIILDTNFFLLFYQFNLDIFSEIDRVCSFLYKLCVVSETLDELNKIIKSGEGRDSRSAVLGLGILSDFVSKGKISIISKQKSFKDADRHILVEVSSDPEQIIVGTEDKELRKKVKNLGGGIIFLRSKSHFILEGV